MSATPPEFEITGPLPLPGRIGAGILRTTLEAGDEEACGLLLGSEDVVRAWIPCRNAHEDPRRSFLLHPEDLRRGLELADRLRIQVLGVWHSHPRGPAQLSSADRRGVPDGWAQWLVAPRAD